MAAAVTRSGDYAMADLATVQAQERKMGRAIAYATRVLGPPIQVEDVVTLNAAVRAIGTVISTAIEISSATSKDQPFVFPSEGLYVVRG